MVRLAACVSEVFNNPDEWLKQARALKKAAERIDAIQFFNTRRVSVDDVREWAPMVCIYRYLIGISIENLLKGVIIAHGTPLGSAGKLEQRFSKHYLERLLEYIDSTRLPFSANDRELLRDLEQYVFWAGRYPAPKDLAIHPGLIGSTTSQHDHEIDLWNRISSHLEDMGWRINADGSRVPIR